MTPSYTRKGKGGYRMKPVNPYSRLLQEIRTFVLNLRNRKTVTMWRYPKEKLQQGWSLTDLWDRVSAANQIGWEVIIEAGDDGLTVKYRSPEPKPECDWT